MAAEDLPRRVRGGERYCSGGSCVCVCVVVHVCFSCTGVPSGSNGIVSGRVCLNKEHGYMLQCRLNMKAVGTKNITTELNESSMTLEMVSFENISG